MASGGYSRVLCTGFSLWRLPSLLSTGSRVCEASVVVARGLSSCDSLPLEHRLRGYGPLAYLIQDMWELPRSGARGSCIGRRILTHRATREALYFDSLMWTMFKCPYCLCHNTGSVLSVGFLGCEPCEILALQPGIEPATPAFGGQSLNHGTMRQRPGN